MSAHTADLRTDHADVRGCTLPTLTAICCLAFALPTEIQLHLGDYYFSISELALYAATAFSFLGFQGNTVRPRNTINILWLIFFISITITLMTTDSLKASISASRNAIVLFFGASLFDRIAISRQQLSLIMKAFLSGAVICAVWGLGQSLFGTTYFPSIYDLHLAAAGDRAQLLGVVAWKYGLLSRAHLVSWQKTLGLGFSGFSGNFAASMAFALCVAMYFQAGKRHHKLFFWLLSIILILAILSSASRIPFIVSCFVTMPLYFIIETDKKRRGSISLVVLLYAIMGGIWLLIESGLLSFDGFGTMSGRTGLNLGGLSEWFDSPISLMFGGHILRYYYQYFQSPHNIIIYLILQFGFMGAIPVLLLLLNSATRLSKSRHFLSDRSSEAFPAVVLPLAALIWFGIYCLTWSVAESASTNLHWALLVGAPLAYLRGLTPGIEVRPVDRRYTQRTFRGGIASSEPKFGSTGDL